MSYDFGFAAYAKQFSATNVSNSYSFNATNSSEKFDENKAFPQNLQSEESDEIKKYQNDAFNDDQKVIIKNLLDLAHCKITDLKNLSELSKIIFDTIKSNQNYNQLFPNLDKHKKIYKFIYNHCEPKDASAEVKLYYWSLNPKNFSIEKKQKPQKNTVRMTRKKV